MKNLLLIAFISVTLTACTDSKKDEKNLLNEILKVHDKVMSNDEMLMKNKMQLDSLIKLPAKDSSEKASIKALDNKLQASEETMENWMHAFEPDVTNKSHDEVMKYYTGQKKQIMSIDSQMNAAITESNKYLSKNKK